MSIARKRRGNAQTAGDGGLQLPSVRTSREQLDQLLADEFMEFGSSGAVYNKRQVIAELLADPENELPRYATMQNTKVNLARRRLSA